MTADRGADATYDQARVILELLSGELDTCRLAFLGDPLDHLGPLHKDSLVSVDKTSLGELDKSP